MLLSADSMPVSTMPGGGDVMPDRTTLDAEPVMRTAAIPDIHAVLALAVLDEMRRPGFAPELDKPPRV